jgi:hypothetical protein
VLLCRERRCSTFPYGGARVVHGSALSIKITIASMHPARFTQIEFCSLGNLVRDTSFGWKAPRRPLLLLIPRGLALSVIASEVGHDNVIASRTCRSTVDLCNGTTSHYCLRSDSIIVRLVVPFRRVLSVCQSQSVITSTQAVPGRSSFKGCCSYYAGVTSIMKLRFDYSDDDAVLSQIYQLPNIIFS